MVGWTSTLCRSSLRHGFSNGCQQPSTRQGLGAVIYLGKSPLLRPSASRWIWEASNDSCYRPHGLQCCVQNEHYSCVGVSTCGGVCRAPSGAFPGEFSKLAPLNTSYDIGNVKNSPIVASRRRSRKVKLENASDGAQLRMPYASSHRRSSTSVTSVISPHLCNWTKIFSCAPHFDIPTTMRISRFSSKPAEDSATKPAEDLATKPAEDLATKPAEGSATKPVEGSATQRAAKDNPDSTGPTDLQPTTTTSALSQEPRPKGIVGYIIFRYTWYIERLQRSLESEMPRTFRMFRIFSVGLKAFIKDFTGYVRVLVQLSFPSERLEGLTLQQLQLYHFMPYDMLKVFPVLAISAIPFGQNLALPIGYLFPRQLLCRHFWDLQQSHDFSMRDLRRRVLYARPVFRCLQASVAGIEPLSDRVRMQSVCHLVGSGRHPRQAQVMELRELFSAAPYGLRNIKRHHVHSLLRLHGLSAVLSRKRLRDHARWLLCHDWALTAEVRGVPPADIKSYRRDAEAILASSAVGGDQSPLQQCDLTSLHVNVLKTSLLLRGISPIGLDSSSMARVLERWLTVSLQLSSADSSLLLHLPVLLFYNHPTNLALVTR